MPNIVKRIILALGVGIIFFPIGFLLLASQGTDSLFYLGTVCGGPGLSITAAIITFFAVKNPHTKLVLGVLAIIFIPVLLILLSRLYYSFQ